MDVIPYKQSNSEILHPRITGDSSDPTSELVSPSERSSATTYYSMQQTQYLPATPATTRQQNDQLPTTTTVLETSPTLLSQPPIESTDHGQSQCTAGGMMNQGPDSQLNTVGSPSTPAPRTGKQKCTRCKRWKTLDQFLSGGANSHIFVGCLECRETAKKYGQSEFGKATRRNYNQTAKGKETRKKYAQSEKGKESRKKYAQTKRAKETRKKYNQSEKAKATRRKRALAKSGRVQEAEQGEEKVMENTINFEMTSGFTDHITFDPSQEVPNERMSPMERAFWQTVTRTMYDQAKRYHSNDMDEHDKFEVDIQLKYRRTR